MPKVEALCISDKKGERKRPVTSVKFLSDFGIETDAHAAKWHRQVSLLSHEDVESFRLNELPDIKPGDFAENVILSGLLFSEIGLGTRLRLGRDVELSITQIGKVCHDRCQIFYSTGRCIMPDLGLFARVESGGTLALGDTAEIISVVPREKFQTVVLTISDTCSRGEAVDTAGPAVCAKLEESLETHIYRHKVVEDNSAKIAELLKHYAGGHTIDLIITVGGTGFSPRDVTPEATQSVVERFTPGLDQAMRAASALKTPRAMLSRGTSGIRGTTLIVNLPGSQRAALENLDVILGSLSHGLRKLRGDPSPCGEPREKDDLHAR